MDMGKVMTLHTHTLSHFSTQLCYWLKRLILNCRGDNLGNSDLPAILDLILLHLPM
jgi:hypothetical protein